MPASYVTVKTKSCEHADVSSNTNSAQKGYGHGRELI